MRKRRNESFAQLNPKYYVLTAIVETTVINNYPDNPTVILVFNLPLIKTLST